jgi:hypothetical protein
LEVSGPGQIYPARGPNYDEFAHRPGSEMIGPGPIPLFAPVRKIVDEATRTVRIREMLSSWQAKLNLTDWDIRFDPNAQPPKESNAEVTFHDSGKAAVITVESSLDYQTAEIAVAHELLHIVIRGFATQAERLLVHVQDDRSRVHLNEMLDDAEEEAIEALARAFVSAGPRVIATGKDAAEWAVFK